MSRNKIMKKLIEKKVIIFSHNDLDGLGCILLGMLMFKTCKYRINGYTNIDKKIIEFLKEEAMLPDKTFDYLYITDISINNDTIEALNNSAYKDCWVMIDHHDTRKDLHNGFNIFVYTEDVNELPNSGTNLFRDYIETSFQVQFNNTTNYFVDMVRSWDTWMWKEQDLQLPVDLDLLRKKINSLNFIKNMYIKLDTDSFNLLTYDDKRIVEEARNDIQYYFDNTKSIEVLGSKYNIGYIVAEEYSSLLADMYLTKNKNVDMLIILNLRRCVGSIRTQRNDLHVGLIAEKLGGGGHEKSSGFTINEELYNSIMQEGMSAISIKI